MSYGKETTCMKLWCVIAASMALMSCISLFASSCTLERTSHSLSDSVFVDQIVGTEIVGTEIASVSYAAESIRALLGCFKTGLELVRNHPLKAFTIFLSLQNNASSIRPPSASGILVLIGVNKTRIYDSTTANPEILGPIALYNNGSGVPPLCNVSVRLSDLAAGNLINDRRGITQKFVNGVWSASGNITSLSPFVDFLSMKITPGFNRSFSLYAELFDITTPTKKIQGTVQVVPCTMGEIFPYGAVLPLSIVMKVNETTAALSNPEMVLSALSNLMAGASLGLLSNSLENCVIAAEYSSVSRYTVPNIASLLEALRRSSSSLFTRAIFLDEGTARELVANDSSLVAVHKVKARLGADFKTCCQESYSQCCPQYVTILPKILALNTMLGLSQTQSSTTNSSILGSSATALISALTPAKTLSSTSETIQAPLVSPENEPPYALIGGVLGGAVAFTGVIALVVAAKRGLLCEGGKKAIAGKAPDPEKAVNEGKIQVNACDSVVMPNTGDRPAPQEIINNFGNQDLPKPATKNHYATTVQIVENAKSVYSRLEGHEI
jgi:hypothetical protein